MSSQLTSVLTQEAPTSAGAVARACGFRVAIASSGLGHIHRGIETWAADTARALRRAGQDVVLFQGAGPVAEPWQQVVPCLRRFDPAAERWVRRLKRLGGWRCGFGFGYQAEQTTFALRLWPRVRRDFDILHVQDSWLALLMDRLHRAGLSRPRVILAHGTEEPARDLRRYSCLQHLAPCYVTDWEEHRPARQAVFAIPNFVDVQWFRPGDRRLARREWGLPEDHLIVLCVAAIKKAHKRVDYLVHEFARFAHSCPQPATLVVAGAREQETDEVVALGRERLGDRVRFLEGVRREKMPGLFQAADLFALASLHEMMPIAVLEALASGLPIACSNTPTLQWMAGPAGRLSDISQEGGLAAQLEQLAAPRQREAFARAARAHAERTFSEPVVVSQVLEMYQAVMEQK